MALRTVPTLTVLAIASVAALSPARAGTPLPTALAVQNAPVRLDACRAERTNPDGQPLDAAHLVTGYAFSDQSDLDAVSVRVKFSVSDARGNFAFATFATDTGRFAPHVSIDRTGRLGTATAGGSPDSVLCSIDHVVLRDATTWDASPSPPAIGGNATPTPAPSANHDDRFWLLAGSPENRIVHGHPTYCTAGESVHAWNDPACRYARFLWLADHRAAQQAPASPAPPSSRPTAAPPRPSATPRPRPSPTPKPSPTSKPSSQPKLSATRKPSPAPKPNPRAGRARHAPRVTPSPTAAALTPCDRGTIDGLGARVADDASDVRTVDNEHVELMDRQAFAVALRCKVSSSADQPLIDLAAATNDYEIAVNESRLGNFDDANTSLGYAFGEISQLLAYRGASSDVRAAALTLQNRARTWKGYIDRRSVPPQ